jgi:hypothetical protein
VTDDFVTTSAGVDVAGRDQFKEWVAGFQAKIADPKWQTIETFANADGTRVSSRFRITSHNNGNLGLQARRQAEHGHRQRRPRRHTRRPARTQLGRTQRWGALQPADTLQRQPARPKRGCIAGRVTPSVPSSHDVRPIAARNRDRSRTGARAAAPPRRRLLFDFGRYRATLSLRRPGVRPPRGRKTIAC